ncbi:MAG: hypothetical protein AABW88_03910 [Nanoarchaeota archaeon]
MHHTEAIKKLETSKEFDSWKKTHKEAYLVHFFKMLDKANESIWQIGYYSHKTNLISVFLVNGIIAKSEDSEVFKEQKKLVQPLKLEDAKIDDIKALQTADEILKKEYKGSTIFKSFMILQNIDGVGQVWNVTFVTNEFKTVNVKVNSKSGECISHKIVSLIQGKD